MPCQINHIRSEGGAGGRTGAFGALHRFELQTPFLLLSPYVVIIFVSAVYPELKHFGGFEAAECELCVSEECHVGLVMFLMASVPWAMGHGLCLVYDAP